MDSLVNIINRKFNSISEVRNNYNLIKKYINDNRLQFYNINYKKTYLKCDNYIIINNINTFLELRDLYYIDIKIFILDKILYKRIIYLFNEFDGFYPYILNPNNIDFRIYDVFRFKFLRYITFNIGEISKYVSMFYNLFEDCNRLKYINTDIKIISKNYNNLDLEPVYQNCKNIMCMKLYYNFNIHIYYEDDNIVYIPILRSSIL